MRCSKLEDVQLASSSISFNELAPFGGCDRLIELAAAAGFHSNTFRTHADFGTNGAGTNRGAGVVPYLIDRIERSERKGIVLVANMRFTNAVHAHDGTEEEKVATAKLLFPSKVCLHCGAKKKKLLVCGGCNKVHYCDSTCQASNWADHKKVCKRARKRHSKGDYRQDKILVGELLQKMSGEGGGVLGLLGLILSYV